MSKVILYMPNNASSVDNFIKSLSKASSDARDWFLISTSPKSRIDFFAKRKIGDDGSGAVYAYFDKENEALYVGETSRPIKSRMHDQTSPHKSTVWWESWESVRFLQMKNRTDRLILELLLIIELQPKHNFKPGPRNFSDMFLNP